MEPGDAHIQPCAWLLGRTGIGDFLLQMHGYVPMLTIFGHGHVPGSSLYLLAFMESKPSELREIDVPVLCAKTQGKPEGIVHKLLFVPGDSRDLRLRGNPRPGFS